MIRLASLARVAAGGLLSLVLALLPTRTELSSLDSLSKTLLGLRDPVRVDRDILVVDATDHEDATHQKGTDSQPAVSVLWALAELDAEAVVLPDEWPAALRSAGETVPNAADPRVDARIEEEFSRIDENIAELFRGIRLGYIKPADAQRFVDELRRLVDAGEVRIRAEIRRAETSDGQTVDQMIDAFGRSRIAQSVSDLGIALPEYSSAVAVPLPPTPKGPGFRRLPLSSLTRYISLDEQLNDTLWLMDRAGYFLDADPRDRPTILIDYLESLRANFMDRPSERRAEIWREQRTEFLRSVEHLIRPELEERLLERLIDELADADEVRVAETKDDITAAFASARALLRDVTELRDELQVALRGSLVFLDGTEDRDGSTRVQPPVIANAALVGEHLIAPVGWYRALLLVGAGILVAGLLVPFRTRLSAVLAPAAAAVGVAGFAALLVAADVWIDPRAVVAVVVASAFASVLVAGVAEWGAIETIVGRATIRLPLRALRRAVAGAGMSADTTGSYRAAVVVVSPDRIGSLGIPELHLLISREIRRLGGVVLGEEGWTVIAGFGTPADRRGNEGDLETLAERVCRCALTLASPPPGGVPELRCGVDIGELSFYSSPIGGYRATGPPIVYARRLCSVTARHGCRILIGDEVARLLPTESTGMGLREFGELVQSDGDDRYAFFELTGPDRREP